MPVLLLLLLASISCAFEWQNITCANIPYLNPAYGYHDLPMTASGDTLYVATTGGLLIRVIDHDKVWTVADGYLTTNEVSCVALSKLGGVWAGCTDGSIVRIDLKTGDGERIEAFMNEAEVAEIRLIRETGDELLVCTASGITRVRRNPHSSGWYISETYRDFGSVGRGRTVYDMQVAHDTLWVATDNGLAYARWHDPLLQSSSAWSRFSGLVAPECYQLLSRNDTLYVANGGGGTVQIYNSVSTILRRDWTQHIGFFNGGVIYCGGSGIRTVSDNRNYGSNRFYSFFCSSNNRIFTYLYEGDSTLSKYSTYLPETNLWESSVAQSALYSIVMAQRAPNGPIVMIGPGIQTRGIYNLFDDGSWTYRTKYNSGPSSWFNFDPMSMKIDQSGTVWVGSLGGGLAMFGRDMMLTFDQTAATGAHFANHRNEPIVVVSAIDQLQNGRIVCINKMPTDYRPLVVLPENAASAVTWRDSAWTKIGWQSAGLTDVNRICVDPWDRVWMGASDNAAQPIVCYDFHGTIENLSDDVVRMFTDRNGLPTDLSINALTFGADAVLYLATNTGLYYGRINETLTNIRFYALSVPISNAVTALAADAAGQIWVGTDRGLALLSADGQSWVTSFTQSTERTPTGLPDKAINALNFSRETGELFISTIGGIAVLKTPYRASAGTGKEFVIQPNPFVVDGTSRLKFGGDVIGLNSEIRLFTPSGLLVRKIEYMDAVLQGWDGKNETGERVATGVYYVIARNTNGDVVRGKVAVIAN